LLRLRLIERLTLDEIGQRHDITKERVRQLLALYFGLRGTRPK
jgi:DNA-directed RNA polymerase sigma subunit (sigma70/sigma32)